MRPISPSIFLALRTSALLITGMIGASLPALAAAPATYTVAEQPTTSWLHLSGQIEAVDQGTVSAQTSGRISAITVDVNDVVPAGQLLIEITNTTQSASLDQARAAVKSAEARSLDAERQSARLAALLSRGSVSRRDYDIADTEAKAAASALKQAKAALVQAGENLGYTRIVSPYAGIVSAKHVSLGETVSPGQALLSGYAFEQMRITTSVPARYVDTLKPDTPINISFADQTQLTLTQHQLFQFADPASHTFTLRMNLPKQQTPHWHAGNWVEVAIPVATTSTIRIPEQSVLRHSELSAVYLQSGQHFILRQIRIGQTQDGQIDVLSGLSAGDVIARDAYAQSEQQGGHDAP